MVHLLVFISMRLDAARPRATHTTDDFFMLKPPSLRLIYYGKARGLSTAGGPV